MDVDRGQFVGLRLKDVAVVVDLDELSPVGGRHAGRRDWRRFERFAEVRSWLTSRGRSHPGLLPLSNLRFKVSRLLPAVSSKPDVAAATWALQGKPFPHPRHKLGPDEPQGVVGAGFCRCAAAIAGSVPGLGVHTVRGILLLADIPFCPAQ